MTQANSISPFTHFLRPFYIFSLISAVLPTAVDENLIQICFQRVQEPLDDLWKIHVLVFQTSCSHFFLTSDQKGLPTVLKEKGPWIHV